MKPVKRVQCTFIHTVKGSVEVHILDHVVDGRKNIGIIYVVGSIIACAFLNIKIKLRWDNHCQEFCDKHRGSTLRAESVAA